MQTVEQKGQPLVAQMAASMVGLMVEQKVYP